MYPADKSNSIEESRATSQLEHNERTIHDLQEQLKTLRARLTSEQERRMLQLSGKETMIQEMQLQFRTLIARQDAYAAEMIKRENRIRGLEIRLNEIETSITWKLAMRSKATIDRVLPPFTLRRKYFDAVLKKMRPRV
jgi:DNA repair exonuclease SbcCD ATPase subunit